MSQVRSMPPKIHSDKLGAVIALALVLFALGVGCKTGAGSASRVQVGDLRNGAHNGRLVRLEGAIPMLAAGSAEALDILHSTEETFGLIITDCHMPEMDGFQFTAELQNRWSCYRNRILMLTSASSAGDAAHCQRIGVTRHVVKPVKDPDLLDASAT